MYDNVEASNCPAVFARSYNIDLYITTSSFSHKPSRLHCLDFCLPTRLMYLYLLPRYVCAAPLTQPNLKKIYAQKVFIHIPHSQGIVEGKRGVNQTPKAPFHTPHPSFIKSYMTTIVCSRATRTPPREKKNLQRRRR